jgi:TonB family protein
VPEPPRDKSLLALRDPAPRKHELTPETADLSLPRMADGDVAMPRQPVRGDESDPAQGKAARTKLALTGKDYEYLFGADAEAERRLAQKQRSTKQGKFQARLARTKAALENFIPEVQPGNQTALNTRAAPFAAYIARMHRSIHEKWGFGQIEEWDEKPSTSPYNNPELLTTLELVLNGDGTIDNVKVIRSSGLGMYDTAAVDVAYSSGPYPDPPREIRSANGKIYIHWDFHRDGRQCATSGVSYFILNNPPRDADKPAVAEPPQQPAGGPQVPHTLGPAASQERALRQLTRDGRGQGSVQALGGHTAPVVPSASGRAAAEQREPAKTIQRSGPRADDPDARAVADQFFAALAEADVKGMAGRAAFPFKTTTGSDVKSSTELMPMLRDLAAEAPRPPVSLQVYTKAGARGVLGGRLPPGVGDDPNLLLAVADMGAHDTLVLVLAPRGGVWKAVGLLRR